MGNVSSPESDMSVKDIVESLGLAPVDIVEPRVELRTHKPPPKIANSPMDDGSLASARHSHVETTQSSSTREESQFIGGVSLWHLRRIQPGASEDKRSNVLNEGSMIKVSCWGPGWCTSIVMSRMSVRNIWRFR